MFKFLLILGIIVYVIYKIGNLFFKAGAAAQHLRDQQRKNFDGNVNADSPRSGKKSKGGSKPGEYIDYEEVK